MGALGLGGLDDEGSPEEVSGDHGEELAVRSSKQKVDELEGSVVDLREQLDQLEKGNFNLREQISEIRDDIDQINNSMKTLLCVYEAVSKEYNPFVEDEDREGLDLSELHPEVDYSSPGSDNNLGSDNHYDRDRFYSTEEEAFMDGNEGTQMMGDDYRDPNPFDLDGPIDRVIRPDEEEDEMDAGDDLMIGQQGATETEVSQRPAVDRASEPRRSTARNGTDPYCIQQVYKLVEYQLNRILMARLNGERIENDDIEKLERWLSELIG